MNSPLSPDNAQRRESRALEALAALSGGASAPLAPALPFFHLCRGERFRAIFASRTLAPAVQPPFNDAILRLHYGKPAVQPSWGGQASSGDIGRFPVCFILNPKSVVPQRVYPFDSGTWANEFPADARGGERTLAKYELGAGLHAVSRFVALFYGSNRRYFYADPIVRREDIPPSAPELLRIHELATKAPADRRDGCGAVVEVICRGSIFLARPNVQAVILPAAYMSAAPVVDLFQAEDIAPIAYSIDRADPADMAALILSLAEDYLKQEGAL